MLGWVLLLQEWDKVDNFKDIRLKEFLFRVMERPGYQEGYGSGQGC
jgi:hypothetical protein